MEVPIINLSTRDLTRVALFTALLAVLARFSIPLPFTPVPLTGQFFGVLLAGVILGSRLGVLAIITYILLGAAGAPVFSNGMGGLQILLGPSGGYLFGFIPGIFLLGKVAGSVREPGYLRLWAGMAGCLAFTYAMGVLQLGLVMKLSLPQALTAGILPFIPLDLLKIQLVAPLARKLKRLDTFIPAGNLKVELEADEKRKG